jgi:hypothetical protein
VKNLALKRLKDRWQLKLKPDLIPTPFEVRVLSFE